MLAEVTPVVLTFNEAPNIERTLAKLGWAREIVVVDSFSTDGTVDLLRREPRVRVVQRRFDEHAAQWNFAIHRTGVSTPWVLALDADYVLTDEIVAELRGLRPDDATSGYRARFTYCVDGKPLWGSLYPPVVVLFRGDRAHYVQDGHAQRLQLAGVARGLAAPIFHDDRKPFGDWREAQRRYSRLEAAKLGRTPWRELRWPDRLRRLIVVAPFAVLVYCLFLRGGLLQGRAGWTYALQRAWAEGVLARELVRQARA
jgi:glycosyltransferase involved in cell wall biosynthesis